MCWYAVSQVTLFCGRQIGNDRISTAKAGAVSGDRYRLQETGSSCSLPRQMGLLRVVTLQSDGRLEIAQISSRPAIRGELGHVGDTDNSGCPKVSCSVLVGSETARS
jgi:hypothetical protein